MAQRTQSERIDAYIVGFPPEIRDILKRIRATVASAAPQARAFISYRMPAFAQEGILVYFAAFQSHIGVFPPFSGDLKLERALSLYAGSKGNLKFPFAQPIPYTLIKRLVRFKLKQNLAKAAARKRPPRKRTRSTA